GEPEDERHDEDERRDGRVFAGEDFINPAAAGMLAALVRLNDGGGAHTADEAEPHIRNGGGAVQPALLFHLQYNMPEHILFILVKPELLKDKLVSLRQLGSRKPNGNAGLHGVILDEVHDGVD